MVKHKWAKELNAFAEGYILQYYDPVIFKWVDAISRDINPITCPQEVWRVKPAQNLNCLKYKAPSETFL